MSSTSSTWSTCCAQRGGEHIQVFGGGGGVIVPAEIRELQDYGVARIYSPEDGQRMGLAGMIGEMVMRCDQDLSAHAPKDVAALQGHSRRGLARAGAGDHGAGERQRRCSAEGGAAPRRRRSTAPVLGITGTGGAGKSSLTDELIRRLRLDQDDALRIAVISIDPSRRKSGGALLGDRIRMNAISPWSSGPRVFMRSLATRDFGSEISQALPDVLAACKAAGFDLIVVETSGIGQGDAAIVPLVDVPMYVMTPEFGAASQLEKIDMLDFAEFVAINKFDRKGAADALRDVAKQVQRNREAFDHADRADAGLRHHGQPLQRRRRDRAVPGAGGAAAASSAWPLAEGRLPKVHTRHSTHQHPHRAAARACATWPTSPTPCAATSAGRARRRAGARDPAAARSRAHAARARQARATARRARC